MERARGPAWAEQDTEQVRLYTLTGGRTRPQHTMRLVSELAPGSTTPFEHLAPEAEQVLAWCRQQPRTVAEIAALLQLPAQITKVILSDLLDSRVLTMTASDTSLDPNANQLEKLLVGLRTLRDAA
ncbi:DUF742 domain-containing protein [Streptomyces misionensis]|uniref:DUF742 domain-containing protein n=1 Tax=Streptomyces misionensis TaxID=67331 RepID=UPI0034437676